MMHNVTESASQSIDFIRSALVSHLLIFSLKRSRLNASQGIMFTNNPSVFEFELQETELKEENTTEKTIYLRLTLFKCNENKRKYQS